MSTGDCPPLSGTYLSSSTELSGDCGPMDDDLIRYGDEPRDSGPECDDLGHTVTPDNCHADYAEECHFTFDDGRPFSVRRVASLDRMGGHSIEGTVEIDVRGSEGERLCRSVYAVSLTRL